LTLTKLPSEIIGEIIEGKPLPQIGNIGTQWQVPIGFHHQRIAGN
jgi:hypothetical protein